MADGAAGSGKDYPVPRGTKLVGSSGANSGPWPLTTGNKVLAGAYYIKSSALSLLPAGAKVTGDPNVKKVNYLGLWLQMEDKDAGTPVAGGKGIRVWASLKYYDTYTINGKTPPGVTTGKWTMDALTNDKGRFFATGKTDFKDFPGLLPVRLGQGDTLVLVRSYYVMVVALSNKDKKRVLSTPLAFTKLTLTIKIQPGIGGGQSTYVGLEENGTSVAPPANWPALLGLTGVNTL
jgi:hypothetical protein